MDIRVRISGVASNEDTRELLNDLIDGLPLDEDVYVQALTTRGTVEGDVPEDKWFDCTQTIAKRMYAMKDAGKIRDGSWN